MFFTRILTMVHIGGQRFWWIDPKADYGPFNDLTNHKCTTKLIIEYYDDLLRLAGSLKLGVVQVSALMRTLQTKDRPTKLSLALQELGRIIKTLYLLKYLDDEGYRRRILTQLNRGESRHALARTIFHGQRGELRQRCREGQEDQLGTLRLVTNVIVLHRALEHHIYGCCSRSTPFRELPGPRRRCCSTVATWLRAHQCAWPLRLHTSGNGCSWRAQTTEISRNTV